MKTKKQKPLWHISVATTLEAEEAVGEKLAAIFGAAAASYFDLEKRTSLVSVFVEQGKFSPAATREEIAAGLDHIARCGLPVGTGEITFAKVKREDWAESWKRHFHPLVIGPELLVKPSWSQQRAAKKQAVVILDPGLSFGTGQHPTTSFCLAEIVRFRKTFVGGKKTTPSFLDLGTGSGILAIAAAKLGFAPIRALDFDPESVRVAAANARKNRVEARIQLARGDVTKLPLRAARQYDLVCANLISNLLISEKEQIVKRVKRTGTLVLAGILTVEFGEVRAAFEQMGLQLAAHRVENEWCSGAFCFV